MQDLDLTQYGEADRQAVDPPVQVQVATWSAAGDGSRLLIFVPTDQG